jgi:hypothetical protein
MAKVLHKQPEQRTYHVDFDEQSDKWDVCSDEGFLLLSCHDKHQAVAFAVRQALHDHAQGVHVIVCVERADGTHDVAWSN